MNQCLKIVLILSSKTTFKVAYNGTQINTVKDMKNEIIKIAKDLEQGSIDLNTARNLLLGLFDVSGSLPLADLEKRLDEVLDKETPETLNKWLEEKRK